MEIDILLLTIYLICISYVVYQMALSLEAQLEDRAKIVPESEVWLAAIQDQLTRQGLPGEMATVVEAGPPPLRPAPSLRLAIPRSRSSPTADQPEPDGQVIVQVLPQGALPIQPLKTLTVQVVNQTRSFQVGVDWDRSSFTLMTNQVRRVIRPIPGMRLDLALPQVISTINPSQFLSTPVTSEETFGRDPNTQVLQVVAPLVDVGQLLALPPNLSVYTLDLVVQLTPLTGRGPRLNLLLPFRFRLERLPAKSPIPYVHLILRR